MTRGPRMAQRALRSSTVSPSLLSPQGFSRFCAEKNKARGTGWESGRDSGEDDGARQDPCHVHSVYRRRGWALEFTQILLPYLESTYFLLPRKASDL
jgi:hypothetical protein